MTVTIELLVPTYSKETMLKIKLLKSSKGFTLIELLIVIAIIGILTTVLLVNLQGVRERARDARRKSDLDSLKKSLQIYYNDAQSYPSSDASYRIVGCGTIAAPTTCSWGSAFATSTATYMSSLPYGPSNSASNSEVYYFFSTNDEEFIIVSTLENASDSEISESQARCASTYTNFTGSKAINDYLVCGTE